MNAPTLEAAHALHRAGRLAEAEAAYRACLAQGLQRAALGLGTVLLQQGRHGEAAAVLEPLAAAQPGDAAVQANLSVALRHCGRLQDALAAARLAVAAAPADVGTLNALGLAALAAGRAQEALGAFEAGLQRAPGVAALQLHRGKCLLQLGRIDAAIAAFVELADAAPTLLEAWRSLAAAQAAAGQRRAALESSRRALALAPGDSGVNLEFAAALLHVDHAGAAAERLEALLEAHGEDVQALTWLGRARLRLGDRPAARQAFERAHVLAPNDALVAHFRAALAGELPADVERDYVRDLFDDFAGRFESTLVGQLDYATPARLAQSLQAAGLPAHASILDLGCGTGLMGVALAGSGCALDGVDLSPRMLEKAQAKGIYRSLHEAELVEFLASSSATWDAIVAADVFNYMADLEAALRVASARLLPGGWLAFSLECSGTSTTELVPETGRYRHVPAQVAALLAGAGLVDIRREVVVLRREYAMPVEGEILLARKPSA